MILNRDLKNFNPRSPCGERLNQIAEIYRALGISIHAPHAGSDATSSKTSNTSPNFNPRSPCGERLCYPLVPLKNLKFQSTLPMRGATISVTLNTYSHY